jgi:hypothetical protein
MSNPTAVVRTDKTDGWCAAIPLKSVHALCPKCSHRHVEASKRETYVDQQYLARLELDGGASFELPESDSNLEDPLSCSECRTIALNPLALPGERKTEWVGSVEIEALSVSWELAEWAEGELVKTHGNGRHEIATMAQKRVAIYAGISTLIRTAFDGFEAPSLEIVTPDFRLFVRREPK